MPIILLCVGGRSFSTTSETLLWDVSSEAEGSENWFQNLCRHGGEGVMHVERTQSGEYFIDRDPDLFDHVLRFLRSHGLCFLDTPVTSDFLTALLGEAKFYGLPELQDVVEQRMRSRETEGVPVISLQSREVGYYSSSQDNAAICFNLEKCTVLMSYGSGASAMLNVLRYCDPMPTIWSGDVENQREFGQFLSKGVRLGLRFRCIGRRWRW